MKDAFVFGFAAYSGTGKTTLIEKIIPILKSKGLRVGVIKHDAHGLKFDHEGKDSKRFSDAGASVSMVSSNQNAAIFIDEGLDLDEAIELMPRVDVIIVEGYKNADIPQIGLNREATGKGFTADLSKFKAVASDVKVENAEVPVFDLNDYEGIAGFIYAEYGRFHSL